MTEHAPFLAFADALADAARAAILPHFRTGAGAENKASSGFDPVTAADRGAEAAMRALIEQTYPDHGILGEEYGEKAGRSGYSWVLDPVDGTRAFIAGLPLWGTLIALCLEGKPIIGVLDQAYLDERFRGWPGGADFTRGGATRPLRASRRAKLSESVLSTTDPNLFQGAEAEAFERVRRAAKLTRLGCDCYAYGMVAMGGVDVVIESGLKPWDIAALIPIIEGAGGAVRDWRGDPAFAGGQVIAAANALVLDEALALLEAGAV